MSSSSQLAWMITGDTVAYLCGGKCQSASLDAWLGAKNVIAFPRVNAIVVATQVTAASFSKYIIQDKEE